ncbi:MAG TPA: sulfurtransferase-like selenium metabolism protein YedF [Anaerolineae bacterium]|nr:sulfurtransferase-like selenium metabolism protein YedF [Anaerolineae bacterium]
MATSPEKTSTVILLTNDGMGNADQGLQHKLIRAYLTLLNEHDILPSVICFFTKGVKLVTEGSPVLDLLSSLEDKGVWLIVCQTCLHHFKLQEKLKVGIVGGMGDILEAQWRAEKVITL